MKIRYMEESSIESITLLRSFSRRIGKTLSPLQKNLLENELPKFQIDKENPLIRIDQNNEIQLEIGIGMAEHFINQCYLFPNATFIGCEPYLNGIANCLKQAKAKNITNFCLYPDDADQILTNIPAGTLSKIFLLFPDPWPKLKQKKRRFAGKNRLKLLKTLLKEGGTFIFASDIPDYVEDVLLLASDLGFIDNSNKDRACHETYVQTKYHSKAIEAGRTAQFLILRKP